MNQPSEIAREALRQLALKRIPPTPDNYRRLYAEIAGEAQLEDFPSAQFRSIRDAMESRTGGRRPEYRPFYESIEARDWERFRSSLIALIDPEAGGKWKELIPDLLREWERPVSGLTQAQKRSGLERILSRVVTGAQLRDEIRELVRSWGSTPSRNATVPEANPSLAPAHDGGQSAVRDLCAQIVHIAAEAVSTEGSPLRNEANSLSERLRAPADSTDSAKLGTDLKRFVYRLTLASEDNSEIRLGTLHLLQLIVDNISELTLDDRWLKGQIAVVKDLVADPQNLRAIDDAERRIRDVIIQQSSLKASLLEARDTMKEMLSGFVQRLAHFADDTSSYHDKIDTCARKIAAATDIRDLNDVLREVMQETRAIQLTAQRSRDELHEARQRVDAAEQRIQQLQDELGRTSELVRHDQLTGALNRRGLEEAFDREIARSRRHETPICLAVLDIDDFKKLNDSLGHQAGDAALIHLTDVIRSALRPQDTVARYGGEEFIIIMPDTVLDDGREALVRLQRALTKRFFLHANQRLLITFSAGVTQLISGCTRDEAISRADELMYEAKRSGKNRVVGA
jgi:diguanylate cyclase